MNVIHEEGDYQFCVLGNKKQKELNQLFAIRTAIWSQEGWEEVPDGEYEIDEFDSSATQMVVMFRGQVMGGFRLINASSAGELPVAQYCKRKLTGKDPAIEVSRWGIDQVFHPKVRSGAHRVMMKGILKYLKSLEIQSGYMDICTFLYKHFEKSGVHLRTLGKVHSRLDGSEFIPAVFDIFKTAEAFGV